MACWVLVLAALLHLSQGLQAPWTSRKSLGALETNPISPVDMDRRRQHAPHLCSGQTLGLRSQLKVLLLESQIVQNNPNRTLEEVKSLTQRMRAIKNRVETALVDEVELAGNSKRPSAGHLGLDGLGYLGWLLSFLTCLAALAIGLRLRALQALHSQLLAELGSTRASMRVMAERFSSLQDEARQARSAADDVESQLEMKEEQLPIHLLCFEDWPDELSLSGGVSATGAFGEIRAGTFTTADVPEAVAVKTLKQQDSCVVAATSEKERRSILWEAQMLAAAANPHVVVAKAVILRAPAIMMELLGPSLLEDCSQLLLGDVCFQLCTGLYHLQLRQILHRDVKRSNVLRSRSDDPSVRLKLVDFECACYACCVHSKAGTPAYWPPEVWSGCSYDYKADVFALGCLLTELPGSGQHEELTLWLTETSVTDRPYAADVLNCLGSLTQCGA